MTKKTNPEIDYSALLESVRQIQTDTRRAFEYFGSLIQKAQPAIAAFVESFRNIPENLQVALLQMANEGWYLDLEVMSLQEAVEIATAYRDGKDQEIESRMVEHFRHRLPQIEETLIQLLPAREQIIRQGFEAHRQSLYFASVPTFLAQADGVCLELLGEHFFMAPKAKKGESKVKNEERFSKLKKVEFLQKILLAPFFSETSIRLGEKKRSEDFDKLNRHLVLHGESIDYGTEVRSLQAIAFLNYLTFAITDCVKRLNGSVDA